VGAVDVTVASRTGRGRPASEDRWVAVTGGAGLLLAVADGMGGTVDGARAATSALAGLVTALQDGPAQRARGPVADRTIPVLPVPSGRDLGGPDLAAAVTAAHDRVTQLADASMPAALRPGTTLTAALVDGRRLRLAHLGDSSCWLLRRGRLRRLTEEHTSAAALVAAGAVQPGSVAQRRLDGMLTRYAGMPGTACPQLTTVRLRPGDQLLIATDGVTRPLPVPRLAVLLAEPGAAAGDLVRAAVDAGGRDDATALLVGIPVDTAGPDLDTRYVEER
jgi:PPM family protein phosphatase